MEDPIIVTFRGEGDEIRQRSSLDEVKVFSTVEQQIRDVVESMRGLFQKSAREGKMKVGVQMVFLPRHSC